MLSVAQSVIIDFFNIIHHPAFLENELSLSLASGIEHTQMGQIDRLVAQIYTYISVSHYYITYESICCITAMYIIIFSLFVLYCIGLLSSSNPYR
jgi:hypothetical protein